MLQPQRGLGVRHSSLRLRGLSRSYPGRCRSFSCLKDVTETVWADSALALSKLAPRTTAPQTEPFASSDLQTDSGEDENSLDMLLHGLSTEDVSDGVVPSMSDVRTASTTCANCSQSVPVLAHVQLPMRQGSITSAELLKCS